MVFTLPLNALHRLAAVARQPQDSARTRTPAPAIATTSGDTYARSRRQDRYTLTVDLATCRIYVLDRRTGEPVARYLTSPGRAAFPTRGDHFTIQQTLVRAPWYPPQSSWARGASVVPGGANNPMGIFKMSLGGYSEYIHGTPASERKELGRPASHGCLRMSNENVLQLFERYAGTGTQVTINRDPQVSAKLREAFAAKGGKDHAITDGAELLPAALKGKAPRPLD